MSPLSPRGKGAGPRAVLFALALAHSPGAHASPSAAAAPSLEEHALLARRRDASRLDRLEGRGRRDVHDVALDEGLTLLPLASSTAPGSSSLEAIDGDADTAWRGARGESSWSFALPFRRPVHLGLVRLYFGDTAERGVPSAFRLERKAPVDGRCEPWALWETLPGGTRDDRDDNTFVHGPREIHAQRQALFADADACALRLVVFAMSGDDAPVLRELRLLESAPSLARGPGVLVEASPGEPVLEPSSPRAVVDGSYEGLWAGQKGASRWHLTVTLPEARLVDRIALTLGHDAVTVPLEGRPGRGFSGGYLPVRYRLSASHDDDPGHLSPVAEADPPTAGEAPLPVRRRLVAIAPRAIRILHMEIDQATGPWGEREPGLSAPVVREIGLYAADDPRPVVTEPLFLSVDANPSGLTHALKGGEANADGIFARDAYHRLRRVLLGFDADSRWPADASRPRGAGTGRFLEVIEGDDPLLDSPLLRAMSPPPVVVLSGGLDWEFEPRTGAHPRKKGHWAWDAASLASSSGRGMGQLGRAVRGREAPFVGFCGGAQLLALLEASGEAPPADPGEAQALIDAVLLRNDNHPIRGVITRKEPYERAWWSDKPGEDRARPVIAFDRLDPLFDAARGSSRRDTLELPSSHGDMLRTTAFSGPLSRFRVVAHSEFCRDWVDPQGLEPTWQDPAGPSRRCVSIPQAFRSIDRWAYPVVGFQFHPEQRDLVRLGEGSVPEARGDALNVVANAVELSLEAYVRLYWPWS